MPYYMIKDSRSQKEWKIAPVQTERFFLKAHPNSRLRPYIRILTDMNAGRSIFLHGDPDFHKPVFFIVLNIRRSGFHPAGEIAFIERLIAGSGQPF